MRLEPMPKPDHVLRVSTRLITSSTILHLSADELERTVNQEQAENPALEVKEQAVCLLCGTLLYSSVCSVCGHATQYTQPLAPAAGSPGLDDGDDTFWLQPWQQSLYDSDNYGFAEIDSEEENDPLARIPIRETLTETLLSQLEALIPPEDAPIAEQLVGSLNERGYLDSSLEEIATLLQIPLTRVEYVLSQLQTLEPLGIGARNLRECLLIQLNALSETDAASPLAYTLIENHLDQLGRGQFHEIARQLKVSETAVREACQYIRSTLHPFPGHTYQSEIHDPRLESATSYINPDIIIRKSETGFEVELIEEKRYNFRVTTQESASLAEETGRSDLQHYIHQHKDRAKFFIECIYRRWQTLKRVVRLVVEYQQDFLERGVRYLRPLTRAEVASRLNLDEGTVSRATANKYTLLPNGRLMPLSDFFDGSLSIKDRLRELIQSENPVHRLSDEELARLLTMQGTTLARRTVTKYREEMGIGSSRERG